MTLFHLAANNGEIGGGEVMLLRLAEALVSLGHDIHVIAPATPDGAGDGIAIAAKHHGFEVTALSPGRREYMRELRAWDRRRDGVLWCNGLVPALATAGHPTRVVHLHQAPSARHVAAGRLAGAGALALVVPSRSMARSFPGSQIVQNWVPEVLATARQRVEDEPMVLGFLGRPSRSKGVDILVHALRILNAGRPGGYQLLLAGEPRFVPEKEQRFLEHVLAPIDHFTEHVGWVNREDFFSRVHVAVFPSVWEEPFGLVAAEAMSARVPVVVSDAGALPEVVGTSYPWISQAGSVTSLLQVLRTITSADPKKISEVTDALHKRWEHQFSPAAGTERLRCLLADLVLPSLGVQS